MIRHAVAGALACFLFGTAYAESVPSFSLDYAKEKATEIVVVGETGLVLETWKGALKPGEKLPFKAGKEPEPVIEIPKLVESKIKSVTRKRRVLFLIRTGGGRVVERGPISYVPASYLGPNLLHATVWVEKGECFAIYQWMNPGDGAFMHPLNMTEKRLKEEVTPKKEKPAP